MYFDEVVANSDNVYGTIEHIPLCKVPAAFEVNKDYKP